MNGVTIHPVHPSVRQLLGQGSRVRPRDMERLPMTAEHTEALHSISMSIFADCTNVGVPFQDAIAAVYLSGLQHGLEIAKEDRLRAARGE